MLYNNPKIAGLAVFIAGTIYLASFAPYGINLWDEGVIYAGGMRYLDGQSVIDDFFGYPPGRYIVTEAVFRLFGPDMLGVRYAFTLFGSMLAFFTFHITRRFMPPLYAMAAVLLVLSAPAVYYQRFYAWIFLFNAWAAIAFIENRKNAYWLAAAAFCTYLFRIELLIFFVPLYAFLLGERFSGGPRVAYSAAIILLGTGAFLASGLGSGLIDIISVELKLWGNPFPLPWESYQGTEFGFFPFVENMLFYLPFIAVAALVVTAKKITESEEKKKLAVLAYLLLGMMSLVVTRAGFDNLLRCLPLFYIGAAYLAFKLVERAKTISGRNTLAAVFALVWLLLIFDFNYNNGFYAGSIGVLKEAGAEIREGRAAGIVVSQEDAAVIENLSKWIQAETSPGDYIFAVPLNPIWYYLARRKNPAYYDWVLPSTLKDAAVEKRLIDELNAAPPSMVIYVDIAIDNREERRLGNYAPALMEWIRHNYMYSGHVSYFQVWRKKVEE